TPWVLTQEAFDQLLEHLHLDPEIAKKNEGKSAGEKYEHIRERLIRYFDGRGCLAPERGAYETCNRIARRLAEVGIIRESLGQFIYGVARHVLQETYRRNKEESLETDEHCSGWDRWDESEELDVRLECLDECLETLPEESRELILEYYQE